MEVGRRRWPEALVGWLDDRMVVLAVGERDPDWLTVPLGTAAVDGPVCEALRRATEAADVAAHLGLPAASFEQVGVLHGLLSLPQDDREVFLRTTLGVLLDSTHQELLQTLRSYLQHGLSTTAASRALYVHRHTLEHRLQRILDLTGLDARDARQRFLLDVAVFLLPR